MRSLGSISVAVGPMRAGKSEWLLRQIADAVKRGKNVLAFAPAIDTRGRSGFIESRAADVQAFPCRIVTVSATIRYELLDRELVGQRVDLVAVDEVQFFDVGLADVLAGIAMGGRRVIASGLDMDFRGEPFEATARLLAVADEVRKLPAVCTRCGGPARMTARMTGEKDRVLVGDAAYEPMCRAHWQEHREGLP